MNSGNLTGRVVADPDLHCDSHGRPATTLQISVEDRRNPHGGPVLVTLVAYGARAQFAARYLRQGRHIAVEGRFEQVTGANQHRQWHKLQVMASSIDFLDDAPPVFSRNDGRVGELATSEEGKPWTSSS